VPLVQRVWDGWLHESVDCLSSRPLLSGCLGFHGRRRRLPVRRGG
jgi:hypothetical protein